MINLDYLDYLCKGVKNSFIALQWIRPGPNIYAGERINYLFGRIPGSYKP